MRKINGCEIGDDTRFDDGGQNTMYGGPGLDKDIRTTEGDDCTYDEPTNCRLREETDTSMMFTMNHNTAVRLNQIDLNVKADSSGKKGNPNRTPAKVAPFDY